MTIRPLVKLGGGLLLAAAGIVANAASAFGLTPEAQQLVALANQERAKRGIRKLVFDARLAELALRHCRDMASRNRLFHDLDLGAGVSGWTVAGENVGIGLSAPDVHRALMASPPHRANILFGKFHFIGTCAVRSNGVLFVTEIFFDRIGASGSVARPAPPPPLVPRRSGQAAAAKAPPSMAAARASVTPVRRAFPKRLLPAGPASGEPSRSIDVLLDVVSLDAPGPAPAATLPVPRSGIRHEPIWAFLLPPSLVPFPHRAAEWEPFPTSKGVFDWRDVQAAAPDLRPRSPP